MSTALARALSWTLLAASAVAVALIVFNPRPPAESAQQRLARWLREVHQTWMPGWVTFDLIEFLANVVMFVPLGFFAALTWRGAHRWLVVALCLVLSGGVELTQTLALPGRFGSWSDVVANTLGGTIGLLIAEYVRRILKRRSTAVSTPNTGAN